MRVLVLSHLLPGDAEPGGARVAWLAGGLAPFGVETHVLALRRQGTPRSEGAPEPEEGELYPEGLEDGREWEIRTYLHMII